MAPDARIVSIKVADAHGNTDVSQVIAAIDWVVQHQRDNGLNIRVLNLSYGTNSDTGLHDRSSRLRGRGGLEEGLGRGRPRPEMRASSVGGSLTNPSIDPYVIAVGAADTQGTVDYTDDTVASFSSNGTVAQNYRPAGARHAHRHPCVTRGSFIDERYGSTGYVTDGLFRGSGTSQAAATVSGAAALLLDQHPEATPDQVKRLLKAGADPLPQRATCTPGRRRAGPQEVP